MATRVIFLAALTAVMLGGAGQTRADVAIVGVSNPGGGGFSAPGGADPLFTFTYSDSAGDVASGTLSAVPSGVGDSFWVTSGQLDVTASADNNWAVGNYKLISVGPSVATSPNGGFFADNLLFPNGDAADGVSTGIGSNPSMLTNWGLLFGAAGPNPGPAGSEINIWGNGNGDYAFASSNGAGNYPILVGSGGSFSAVDPPSATPEPGTMSLFGVGAVIGLGYSRRKRKKPAR